MKLFLFYETFTANQLSSVQYYLFWTLVDHIFPFLILTAMTFPHSLMWSFLVGLHKIKSRFGSCFLRIEWFICQSYFLSSGHTLIRFRIKWNVNPSSVFIGFDAFFPLPLSRFTPFQSPHHLYLMWFSDSTGNCFLGTYEPCLVVVLTSKTSVLSHFRIVSAPFVRGLREPFWFHFEAVCVLSRYIPHGRCALLNSIQIVDLQQFNDNCLKGTCACWSVNWWPIRDWTEYFSTYSRKLYAHHRQPRQCSGTRQLSRVKARADIHVHRRRKPLRRAHERLPVRRRLTQMGITLSNTSTFCVVTKSGPSELVDLLMWVGIAVWRLFVIHQGLAHHSAAQGSWGSRQDLRLVGGQHRGSLGSMHVIQGRVVVCQGRQVPPTELPDEMTAQDEARNWTGWVSGRYRSRSRWRTGPRLVSQQLLGRWSWCGLWYRPSGRWVLRRSMPSWRKDMARKSEADSCATPLCFSLGVGAQQRQDQDKRAEDGCDYVQRIRKKRSKKRHWKVGLQLGSAAGDEVLSLSVNPFNYGRKV